MFPSIDVVTLQANKLLQGVIIKQMIVRILIPVAIGMSLAACTGQSSGSGSKVSNSKKVAATGSTYQDLTIVNQLPLPTNAGSGVEQPIAANDLLEIDVFQVDELDKTARVDSSGRISLPLVGLVQVAGKSVQQVEVDLEKKYGAKYLNSPDISVFVKESIGQQIVMDGEFRKPGIYGATTRTTLIQLVAQSGGLTELADENRLFVFREFDNKKLAANYSLKDIRAGSKPDPRLFGGDTVVAFTSDSKIAAKNLREALSIASSAVRVATPF